jgi:hypothetical protein
MPQWRSGGATVGGDGPGFCGCLSRRRRQGLGGAGVIAAAGARRGGSDDPAPSVDAHGEAEGGDGDAGAWSEEDDGARNQGRVSYGAGGDVLAEACGAGGGVEEATEEEEEEYDEVEEEVEVDYTMADYAEEALESLGTWSDVAAWGTTPSAAAAAAAVASPPALASFAPATLSSASASASYWVSSSFAAGAVRPISAAAGGGLAMAPGAGLAVVLAFVFGALAGRRAAEERADASAGVLSVGLALALPFPVRVRLGRGWTLSFV